MKRNFSKYLGLSALIALTACSSDEDTPARLQNGIPVSDVPITIGTEVSSITEGDMADANKNNNASRANSWAWVGEFTASGGSNPLTAFACYAFAGNNPFFDNEVLLRDTNTNACSWRGGQTWYWPKDDNLNFYAFAPYNYRSGAYNDNDNRNSGMDVQLSPGYYAQVKDFEVNNPPVADVMYAVKRNCNRWQNDGNVNLRFEHALSMIEVYIENYHPYCDVAFCGADFVNLKYHANMQLPNWDNADTNYDDTKCWYTDMWDARKSFNTAALGTDQYEKDGRKYAIARTNNQNGWVPTLAGSKGLFLLPQHIDKWNYNEGPGSWKPQLRLYGFVWDYRNNEYLFDSYNNAGQYLIVPLAQNDDGIDWEPGKRYTYTIKFGLNGGDTMGWTNHNQEVAIPVTTSVEVSNWNWVHWHWWMY